MPTPQPPDGGILDHFDQLWKIITPLISIVGGIIVWAWKRLERSVDKLEVTLTRHTDSDDEIHDKLFTDQRTTNEKLDQLIGEHRARHEVPARELQGHSLIGRSNEAHRNP